jgi:heterodisulfide reductase subunit B
MRIAYYPGCSLETSGRAYDESTRAITPLLGIELEELEDWNCCGATTYMSVRELLSICISARNLCLAASRGLDIVAPCSACFTVLRKTDHYLQEIPALRKKVSAVLEAAGLRYTPGSVRVRHLLELFFDDDDDLIFRDLVTNPLRGLRVAPYYGCQLVRPMVEFDAPENPVKLDRVIDALGALVSYFPSKTRCCGASLMASNEPAALRLCKNILVAAAQNNADCIVTACPLCQMNLDGFQHKVNATYGTRFAVPVLYFTQLVGLALGLPPAQLGIGREIVSATAILERFTNRLALPPASAVASGEVAR